MGRRQFLSRVRSVCLRKDCGQQRLWAAIPEIGGVDFFFLKI
jgi:hypothetical protein